eukprot:TRINITY_DN49472_c0_g1_i1.p1 TRINITY_DN49472_c0_g1~~TRINITY_DN49472_c0_g1_i1.p1  ORF type:complete len:794 (-),score=127.31 TRINITY_DN49472_c0_g1_i1:129-2423(-)
MVAFEDEPLKTEDPPSSKFSDQCSEVSPADSWMRTSRVSLAWAAGEVEQVRWQWLHRNGFRDYDIIANEKIEASYQRGESHVRLKTGKNRRTPMEIFFVNMIQNDPITRNTRKVRRLGPDSWCGNVKRWIMSWIRYIETGSNPRVTFDMYDQRRKDLLASLENKEQNAMDIYGTNCAARCVRSVWFQIVSMMVVMLNTIWIGIDAQYNNEANVMKFTFFVFVEYIFCILFILELATRFFSYRLVKLCLLDAWFVFDFVLVFLMVLELWALPLYLLASGVESMSDPEFGNLSILRMARLLRLTRLSRIARLLRMIPEVMTLLKGITLALRSVGFTMLLLVVLLFIFGVIMKQQAEVDEVLAPVFPTVTESMWILLVQGAFLDEVGGILGTLKERSWALTIVFLFFVFLGCFTVLNMLIGILCEVMSSVSRAEKDFMAVAYLKSTLLDIMECHDKDDDRHIHKSEFDMMVRNPDMHATLVKFGVSVSDLISLKDVLFEQKVTNVQDEEAEGDMEASNSRSPGRKDSLASTASTKQDLVLQNDQVQPSKISFAVFLEIVLRLRGGNRANVNDIVDLRDYLRYRLDRLEHRIGEVEAVQPAIRHGSTSSLDVSTDTCSSVPNSAWRGYPPQHTTVNLALNEAGPLAPLAETGQERPSPLRCLAALSRNAPRSEERHSPRRCVAALSRKSPHSEEEPPSLRSAAAAIESEVFAEAEAVPPPLGTLILQQLESLRQEVGELRGEVSQIKETQDQLRSGAVWVRANTSRSL